MFLLDHTHDPLIGSWVPGADDHPDFPVQNLPLCIFARGTDIEEPGRAGVRIGDHILDLSAVVAAELIGDPAALAAATAAGRNGSLNDVFALGAAPRQALRHAVHALLREGAPERDTVARMLTPVNDVQFRLPARVGDYTDFYAGIHHARRVGMLFRPDNPLLPNYQWIPVGYHGRASTVHVSDNSVVRPRGQVAGPDGSPSFEPSSRLDFELELGVWLCDSPTPGTVLPIARAAEQVAGYCLLNDWSARDIQSWEYQPLGPFLSKSFATSVSPYVVTPEALAPYRCALTRPAGDPTPLDYLSNDLDLAVGGLDIDLEVEMSTATMRAKDMPVLTLSRSSSKHLYWTVAQLIAHHVAGGCELNAGDLLGTGTISSADETGLGSLLELSRGGQEEIRLPSGETRTFLLDGDEVTIRGRASHPGRAPIGFGECRGRVLPSPMAGTAVQPLA